MRGQITCLYAGCANSAQKRGYCRTHYSRVKREGTLPGNFSLCSLPNCFKRMEAHGYCATHLARWRRRGDARYVAPRGFKYAQGYVLIKCLDHPFAEKRGWVRLHRLIMEKQLGRYLTEFEDVHHVDSNRANNAPENLRVVTRERHATEHATKYSDADIVAEIRRVAALLHKRPSQSDFAKHGRMSATTPALRFGGWRAAVDHSLTKV
jgi:hypothetical protein